MQRAKEIEILLADGITSKAIAESRLNLGTQIYEKPEEWIDSLKESGLYEGQTIEEARDGRYAGDISVLTYNGHEYLIEYVN